LESGYQNATSCRRIKSHKPISGNKKPKKFRITPSSGMIPHIDETDSTGRK
jgi:hypothetical protein